MNRSGKSLIEMLIVISLLSTVLLICGQTLTAMFRAETAQARTHRRMSAQSRLADRFRADVHAATKARSDAGDAEDAGQLVLSLPDGRTVTYALGNQVTRTLHDGEQRIAFDAWPFDREEVRFELPGDGTRGVLVVRPSTPSLAGPRRKPDGEREIAPEGSRWDTALRVEAIVGFDDRRGKDVKP